jgi:hypothetical protein
VSTDVSEEHIASIFRVEKLAEQETSMKSGGKQSKTEAICSSKTLVDFQQTTRRYIPEDGILHGSTKLHLRLSQW